VCDGKKAGLFGWFLFCMASYMHFLLIDFMDGWCTGILHAIDPIVNLATVNYILHGLQRYGVDKVSGVCVCVIACVCSVSTLFRLSLLPWPFEPTVTDGSVCVLYLGFFVVFLALPSATALEGTMSRLRAGRAQELEYAVDGTGH
jgi:hypothetical protein